jgi:hypothetical protein
MEQFCCCVKIDKVIFTSNPAERLMPGGTLSICVKISILPCMATLVHGSVQDGGPVPAPSRALTGESPTNIFEDMVDNFFEMKLGSILIIFEDGDQKCHAFPLAARHAFWWKFFILLKSCILRNSRFMDLSVL